VQIERELYAASEQRLLDRLRAVEDSVESLMLIGHNPGLEQLALSLASRGQTLAILRRKYPTGALATLEFSGRWGDLRPGSAELTDFVTPKQLAKR
jgi:phosphohistidine phosphatase